MKTLWAHGFNQRPRFEQVAGYLERNEPLPLDQPDRKATSFVTSHFYLDDFVQSSEDPNPRPLQHTPLQAIPEDGFRTPAEATDEDVRLARRCQGYGGTRFVEDDLVAANEPPAPEFSPRRVLKNYGDMTTSEFQSHLIKLDTTFRGDKALNTGKRPPNTEDEFVHLQSRALLQLRKQLQDDQLQTESLLVVGAHVLRELVPVPAGQVADQLAVLQRRADGPPGPGVQHGRQLPEVSQQQELHVGVQPHAGQVRPERHVQLRDLLHHQPVQLLRAAPAHVPAHPVVGRLRPQAQVLRGAVRLGHQRPALAASPGASFRCPAGSL